MIQEDQAIIIKGGEGVDLIKYSLPKQDRQMPKKRFKIVMIGRVLKTKGYIELEECARRCKEQNIPADFYIDGGEDEVHPVRIPLERIKKAEADGLLEFKGHILNLKEFLEDADCVVLPSYYNEGINRSLMEALSMGIPIITTDNRGCRELVIDRKTGFIIPPRDLEALFEAVKTFINLSEEQKTEMKIASRKYAEERFDINDVISVYRKIVSE